MILTVALLTVKAAVTGAESSVKLVIIKKMPVILQISLENCINIPKAFSLNCAVS